MYVSLYCWGEWELSDGVSAGRQAEGAMFLVDVEAAELTPQRLTSSLVQSTLFVLTCGGVTAAARLWPGVQTVCPK